MSEDFLVFYSLSSLGSDLECSQDLREGSQRVLNFVSILSFDLCDEKSYGWSHHCVRHFRSEKRVT